MVIIQINIKLHSTARVLVHQCWNIHITHL
jgi:hypothetical protein